MPRPVRLTRLRPEIQTLSGSDTGGEEAVRLEIRAEARNEEAMLEFVGRLFEHPAFRNPNLASENRRAESTVTEFALTAFYLPARSAAALATAETPSTTDNVAPGAAETEPAVDLTEEPAVDLTEEPAVDLTEEEVEE